MTVHIELSREDAEELLAILDEAKRDHAGIVYEFGSYKNMDVVAHENDAFIDRISAVIEAAVRGAQ